MDSSNVIIKAGFYNELTTNINIPGLLIAEKDSSGFIWQTKLYIHPKALRSGLNNSFDIPFLKINKTASVINTFPIYTYVNGKIRNINVLAVDPIAENNSGIAILPHCFISEEIFLQ